MFNFCLVDLDAIVGASFTFTNERIEALKKEARSGKVDLKDRIVSTNDVLCAYMWKLSAIVREEDPLDQKYLFGEIINFRKHLSLGKNYPWNAFTQGSINHLTRGMLIDSDLSEIVQLVRNLTESYTPEVISSYTYIVFMYRLFKTRFAF